MPVTSLHVWDDLLEFRGRWTQFRTSLGWNCGWGAVLRLSTIYMSPVLVSFWYLASSEDRHVNWPLSLEIPELLGWADGKSCSTFFSSILESRRSSQIIHLPSPTLLCLWCHIQTLQCHTLLFFILVYWEGPVPETSVFLLKKKKLYVFTFCLKRVLSCRSIFKIGSRWLGDYLCCFSSFCAFSEFFIFLCLFFFCWFLLGCDDLSLIPAKRSLLLGSEEKGWPLSCLSTASRWLFLFFFFLFV